MTEIILRRIDDVKNMRRFYRMDVQRDLFGAWDASAARDRRVNRH
jgi:hypothetical protein